MRDDRHKWDHPRDRDARLETEGLTISQVFPIRQTLISGVHVREQVAQDFCAPLGWPDIADTPTYALSIRRDRVLLVNGPDMADGWHEGPAQAVSDASDAYAVFELAGPSAMSLLKRGTEISRATPSGSVARMLFGFGTFLYGHKDADTFCVHVSNPQSEALWKTFKSCIAEGA